MSANELHNVTVFEDDSVTIETPISKSLHTEIASQSIFEICQNRLEKKSGYEAECNILSQLYSTVEYDDDQTTLYIGNASLTNEHPFTFTQYDVATITSKVQTRELTEDEQSHFSEVLSPPRMIYSVSLPPISKLSPKNIVKYSQHSTEQVKQYQKEIETWKRRNILAKQGNTSAISLPPEINPYNTKNDTDETRSYISGHLQGLYKGWKTQFSIQYKSLLAKKLKLYFGPTYKQPRFDFVNLNMTGHIDEVQCELCNKIAKDGHLLTLSPTHSKTTKSVCLSCAIYTNNFDDTEILQLVHSHPTYTEERYEEIQEYKNI